MFKKIYFKVTLYKAYFLKNIPFIVVGLVLGSLVSIFKVSIIKFINSAQPHQEIIGINGLYTINKLPSSITNLISYGLTVTKENNHLDASPLVKSWAMNPANTEYTFQLNNHLTWHNGKKFTAYDVNYVFSGTKFQAINNTTLKAVTDTPFAPFLALVDKPLFMRDLVGVGPYQVTSIDYQDSYIKDLYLKSLTSSPDKEFHFYADEKSVISAYRMGKIDIIDKIEDSTPLQSWPKTEITPTLDYQRYLALFINTDKFKDKKFRQALAYATPKPLDRKDRCLGPISPNSWAFNNDVKSYDQNTTRAKELFDKNSPNSISIALNDPRLLPLAEDIKSAWNSTLGITVSISIVGSFDTDNYDVILAYGGIPTDPDQYQFWHSTQKTNITKENNSRIDKLLEEGRLTFDPVERKKIYLDFQRYLLEESPAIFLSYPTVYSISRVK